MKHLLLKKRLIITVVCIGLVSALPFTHSILFKKLVINEIQLESKDSELDDAYINVYDSYISMEKIKINKPEYYLIEIDKIESQYDFDINSGYKYIEEIKINGGRLVVNSITKQKEYPDFKTLVRSIEINDFSIDFVKAFPQASTIEGGVKIIKSYFPQEMNFEEIMNRLSLDLIGFDQKFRIKYNEGQHKLVIRQLPLGFCPYLSEFGLQHFSSGCLDIDISYKIEDDITFNFEIMPRDLKVTIPKEATFTESMILKSIKSSIDLLEGKYIPVTVTVTRSNIDKFIYDLKYLRIEEIKKWFENFK